MDIECSDCGAEFDVTTDQIARGAIVECPNGHTMKLVDDGGGAAEVQKGLDDIDRAIRRLGDI